MEAEDDMIFLVVVHNDEKTKSSEKKIPTSEPSETCIELDNIIETVQKYGEYISIEPKDEYQSDDLEDGNKSETESDYQPDVKEDIEQDSSDEEYFSEDKYSNTQHQNKKKIIKKGVTILEPSPQQSLVAELRAQNEELRDDEELLINTLGNIMRSVKPPAPPPDFYIKKGTKFECVYCGWVLDTLPAASRHFQHKHGERYLVCYACGLDFTCTANLYKHEKRCVAPDAEIVLRARGVFLGRKGRSRPFLTLNKFSIKQHESKFPCSQCSAVFLYKTTLMSHENLHRGERPYRCHACPNAYTSSSALSRHFKIQHTDVQFFCDHCGRAFKIKAALVSHMGTHRETPKYGCEECDRRFAHKCALQLHVHRVHRKLPPPCACQICPKRYPHMYLLKAHMKREHGMSIITRKMFTKTLPTMSDLDVKLSTHIKNMKKTKC